MQSDLRQPRPRRLNREGSAEPFRVRWTAVWSAEHQTVIGESGAHQQPLGDHPLPVLQDHITIAVEILQAAKAGDADAFEDAKDRWYVNANEIADFLSAANPKFWPNDMMRADMKTHLDQTLAEAADELAGEYEQSVADYEEVHLHILAMADMLSSGIIGQFPKRFR